MRHYTVLLLILSACGVCPASAQIGGPYSITGTVRNERGKPVKGARVEAWKVVGDFVEGCVCLVPSLYRDPEQISSPFATIMPFFLLDRFSITYGLPVITPRAFGSEN